MAIELTESGLQFSFAEDAVKFDETAYYRKFFWGKGVDFIALSPMRVQMIEVKNCLGHEAENEWRIGVNNSSRAKRPPGLEETDRESLDIEIAKKAKDTIACLYGAWSKASRTEKTDKLLELWTAFTNPKIPDDKISFQVILFLEGNFGSMSRPKKSLMRAIEDSVRKKLQWLNCTVSVIDSETCAKQPVGFTVAIVHDAHGAFH